jgi:hypothetical protein
VELIEFAATSDLLAERRRLLAEVHRLRGGNDDLREQPAYAHREIEQLRPRLIAVINPSPVGAPAAQRRGTPRQRAFTAAP